jgi:hypothetical protein
MLTIQTREGGTWFRPGETIQGEASWHLDGEAESIEIRLFWFTAGKGTRDVEIVGTSRIERPESSGTRPFELAVPRGPYSFSGKLITLSWAIEIVALPSGETERLDLNVGPTPVEVDIS